MDIFMCSNPDCTPKKFGGLVGTMLEREYYEVKNEGYCYTCKNTYNTKILDSDICPRCKLKLKPKKAWHLKCPKCGRGY